jgi:hypothetical protein
VGFCSVFKQGSATRMKRRAKSCTIGFAYSSKGRITN